MSDATSPTAGADTLGRAFAYAIARRDFGELGDLLHPDVELRALTPRRSWEPADHDAAVEVLRTWWGDCRIDDIEHVDASTVGDLGHVAYRFTGQRPDGPFVVEQHAYFTEQDGRIAWMRVLCSGFRTPRSHPSHPPRSTS
jgi:ketosteroid isomerase-like protein